MSRDYEYRILDIGKDGTGDYHVNRYSILFYPKAGESIESIEKDFKNNFAGYFNGTGQHKNVLQPGIKNIAEVVVNGECFKEKDVYAFTLEDTRVHTDYVSEIATYPGKEKPGFAFATLRRVDLKANRMMDEGRRLNGRTQGGLSRWIADNLLESNENHVLAGRRSWLIAKCEAIQEKDIYFLDGSAPGAQKKYKPFAPGEACLIQTAAIERYSGLVPIGMGWLLGDRELVDRIWSNQLVNFVKMKKYKHWSRSLKVFYDRTDHLSWNEDGEASSGIADAIFSDKRSFDVGKKQSMYKDAWVNSLVAAHPALKSQFSDWK
ncbi:hypothetical protein POL68_35345 [Stigmatella sp. ncwal1]|uniref:Uncharacterized protein n=1 Tax=Stigmatella ashevillensis TaxID=2995309 RepID=A0ABT5DJU1_9BACT|nr:hypothetical protein [Stigmatella ashevillena]MDC0713796.1 hypothetical protein [Stigmatella ashevillena]